MVDKPRFYTKVFAYSTPYFSLCHQRTTTPHSPPARGRPHPSTCVTKLLRQYVEARKSEIAARHVAQKSPKSWYRTIDRIYPTLASKPKLLIPDIKGEAHIVYESGRFYPHHNLYYITSEEWDLKALQ